MPCCAFAAFIVGQILVGIDAARRFLTGSVLNVADLPRNPATEWTPFSTLTASPLIVPRRRSGIRAIALLASIEVLLAIGAMYGIHHHRSHHHPAGAAAHSQHHTA
jgi:hypothetical protein